MRRFRSGRTAVNCDLTALDEEFRGHFEDAQARSRLLRDLLEWRHTSGRSQKSIAQAMGTVQSAVSDLEGGGTDPRLSTLQRYARAVGTKLSVEVPKRLDGDFPVSEFRTILANSRTETQTITIVHCEPPEIAIDSADQLRRMTSVAS
jgi:transcriptional regulator with XRE-family HTH domain